MKKIKFGKMVAVVSVIVISLVFFLQGDKIWLLWTSRLKPEPLPSHIEQPNQFTAQLAELTPENIETFGEIAAFRLTKRGGQIVAISQDSDNERIMVIEAGGTFAHWELSSQQLIREYDFYSAFLGSTDFSLDGSRLMAGGGAVWNTEDGTIIYCPAKCTDLSLLDEEFLALLDPSGTVIITYGNIHISGVEKENLRGAITYLHNDCFLTGPEGPVPGVNFIAIDPSDTYLAYILTNGVICIKDFNGVLGYDLETGEELPDKKVVEHEGQLRYDLPGNSVQTRAMTFDPARKWLAVVTDKELAVLDLQDFFFPKQIYQPLDDGNTLSFDHTGNLLALGTKQGIILYDVEKGKQIAEFKVGDVTALYFSRDNRLLIWGDAKGNVHIWGVP